jgi:tetratricopeptide (TPR) repeat protein
MKITIIALVACTFGLIYPPNQADVIRDNPDFFAEHTIPAYKLKTVREVFSQLKNAKGDFRSRRPILRFVKDSGGGPAVAYPKQGLIVFEEKAYDICAGFGKDSLNALANILAHELVHCYEKHDWEDYFAHESKGFGMDVGVKDEELEDEVQADYLGGFLSYQAGFTTFGIAPKFMEKVYETYHLTDEKLSRYPKLKERQAMAAQSEQKLKDLLDLFEMGNFLAALELYDDALEYYLKVLEDFQSREVYNNVGVLSTLSAMKMFAPTENKFAYPVELDVRSSLNGTRGNNAKELREEKLMEALDYFEKARQYDAFYPIAYLNEGCAHALLGLSQKENAELEWEDAAVAANRAIRLTAGNPKWLNTETDAKLLLGILRALALDSLGAEAHFAEALQLNANHFLTKANQNTLRGKPNTSQTPQGIDLSKEIIDDLPFSSIKLNKTDVRGQIVDAEEHKITMVAKSYAASVVFANASITGSGGNKVKKDTFLQMTGPGYSKQTNKGIKLGDKLAKVLEKYGEPQARVNLGSGTMLRYKNATDFSGLIFQFDGAGKLMRWVIYK